jgi:hypothetical protein
MRIAGEVSLSSCHPKKKTQLGRYPFLFRKPRVLVRAEELLSSFSKRSVAGALCVRGGVVVCCLA